MNYLKKIGLGCCVVFSLVALPMGASQAAVFVNVNPWPYYGPVVIRPFAGPFYRPGFRHYHYYHYHYHYHWHRHVLYR